jgi:hypothetical protein
LLSAHGEHWRGECAAHASTAHPLPPHFWIPTIHHSHHIWKGCHTTRLPAKSHGMGTWAQLAGCLATTAHVSVWNF